MIVPGICSLIFSPDSILLKAFIKQNEYRITAGFNNNPDAFSKENIDLLSSGFITECC